MTDPSGTPKVTGTMHGITCADCERLRERAEQAERALVEVRAEGVHLQGKIAAASDKIEQAERALAEMTADRDMWKGWQAAQSRGVQHLSDENVTLRTQLHAAQGALDELIRLHDEGCGCRPPNFCEYFVIADILDLRAALSPRPPA